MGESVVLGDRYELCSLIGQGGVADLYRALDRVLDRAVAVKLLRQASVEARVVPPVGCWLRRCERAR